MDALPDPRARPDAADVPGHPPFSFLPRPATRRGRWLLWTAAAAAGAMALAAAWLLRATPPDRIAGLMPCPLRAWTGFLCPGCGSGRAAHAFLNGDWARAWACNKLLWASVPFLLFYGWDARRARPWIARSAVWAWAMAAAVLAYGVLRNLPLPPFSWLAPPG